MSGDPVSATIVPQIVADTGSPFSIAADTGTIFMKWTLVKQKQPLKLSGCLNVNALLFMKFFSYLKSKV